MNTTPDIYEDNLAARMIAIKNQENYRLMQLNRKAKAQEPMHTKRKKKNRKKDQIQKHSRKMNRR